MSIWAYLSAVLNVVLLAALVRLWRLRRKADRCYQQVAHVHDQLLVDHGRLVRTHNEVADLVAFVDPWPAFQPRS